MDKDIEKHAIIALEDVYAVHLFLLIHGLLSITFGGLGYLYYDAKIAFFGFLVGIFAGALAYLYEQFRATKILLSKTLLCLKFPMSFFKKERFFSLDRIKAFYFNFNVSSKSDPFFEMYMKDRSRHKFRIWQSNEFDELIRILIEMKFEVEVDKRR